MKPLSLIAALLCISLWVVDGIALGAYAWKHGLKTPFAFPRWANIPGMMAYWLWICQ